MRSIGRSKLRKAPKRERRRAVAVRSYCRRPGRIQAAWQRTQQQVKEWGF